MTSETTIRMRYMTLKSTAALAILEDASSLTRMAHTGTFQLQKRSS